MRTWWDKEFWESATPATVATLLKAGVDVTARDAEEATPLHLAAKYNTNAMVVGTLLKAGADVAARDVEEATPLHLAAWYNEPEVVTALVDAGAALTARS
ncbi:MAG: ankyrin repeat domain-containing protein, partial [Desulfurellaceae bacterium]|nr:ankyrin repeat domain-containing protein [Desulfurellaceae bacterium]